MPRITDIGIQGKGILATARLFGSEYVKGHIRNACASLTSHPVNGNLEHFLGFESDGGLWIVYAYMSLDVNTGGVQFLDYRRSVFCGCSVKFTFMTELFCVKR